MSLKRIAKELGVSPSSVLTWTGDIELTDPQRKRCSGLAALAGTTVVFGGATRPGRRAADHSEMFQREGRARARRGDLLHQARCLLYRAEGSKGRNTVESSNSDVYMARLFRTFLSASLDVEPAEIRMSLNV